MRRSYLGDELSEITKKNSFANVHIFFDEILGCRKGEFLRELIILFNESPIDARVDKIFKIIIDYCNDAAKIYTGLVIHFHFDKINDCEEIFISLFHRFEEEKIIVKKINIQKNTNLIVFSLAWCY